VNEEFAGVLLDVVEMEAEF